QSRRDVQIAAHRVSRRITAISVKQNIGHMESCEPFPGSPPTATNHPPLSSPSMHLNELNALHVSQLLEMAASLDIDNASRLRKQELMFAIMKKRVQQGEQIFGDGVLEVLPDGFGFLRSPQTSYLASTVDIYISPSQIRRFNLHTGDSIEGEVRTPKDC